MAGKSLDEEIEEAMRLVDGSSTPALPAEPPPQERPPEREAASQPQEPSEALSLPATIEPVPMEPEAFDGPPQVASPTLQGLDENRRPKPEIACGTCPNSVWFATPSEVRCYCRVMFVQTWTTRQPGEIVSCDGMYLGQN